jgi:hypothetical protein
MVGQDQVGLTAVLSRPIAPDDDETLLVRHVEGGPKEAQDPLENLGPDRAKSWRLPLATPGIGPDETLEKIAMWDAIGLVFVRGSQGRVSPKMHRWSGRQRGDARLPVGPGCVSVLSRHNVPCQTTGGPRTWQWL